MKRKIFGIIPARFASSRFPGKPLAQIHGKPLIQHVYERVVAAGLDKVVVATDSEEIKKCVQSFGGEVIMTSEKHASGTDRCGEAAQILNPDDNDIVINIQGDEPLISKKETDLLANAFADNSVQIATLVNPFSDKTLLQDANVVKVVKTKFNNVLYFSRLPIPFLRDGSDEKLTYFRHIGIYAYTYRTLKEIVKLEVSELERREKLEQLRWLENGYCIKAIECDYKGIGIDTPQDLENFINLNIK